MVNDRMIRYVAKHDFERWLPLWAGYNAFYGRSGLTALDSQVTDMSWSRFLDAAEPVHALVAEADGELIGLAHFLYHRSTTAIGMSCYLQDLFTSAAQRGSGVGGALIRKVFAEAKAAGCNRVYWQTHETNHAAMHLYDKIAERSGFVIYTKNL